MGTRRLNVMSAGTTARLREELAGYDVVPMEVHGPAVREQHRLRLDALSEQRPMNRLELAAASELAQDRARRGLPIDTLIGAYHIGDQELWRTLVAIADEEQEHALPRIASHMLESLHAISMALTGAHAEITRAQQGHRVTVSQRLIELLVEGTASSESYLLAEALDLKPSAESLAVAWRRWGTDSRCCPGCSASSTGCPAPGCPRSWPGTRSSCARAPASATSTRSRA